jgi:hypothetical protein
MSKPSKRRRSRSKPGVLPKGAYRVPSGGYVTAPQTVVAGPSRNERRISIQAVRRDPPDFRLLATALVALAQDVAQREHDQSNKS